MVSISDAGVVGLATLMSFTIVISGEINDIKGPIVESHDGIPHDKEILDVRRAPDACVVHEKLVYLP